MNRVTHNPRWRARTTSAAALAAALVFSACGGSTSSPNAATAPASRRTHAVTPSTATKMICASEAQTDIAKTLGVGTIRRVEADWKAPRYSCDYEYGDGAFTLAVEQLADPTAAAQYYASLATRLGRRTALTGLGEAATTTTGGAVIVRKDNSVLTVDPAQLPARFGKPPDTRANVAVSVAATIMGCWTET